MTIYKVKALIDDAKEQRCSAMTTSVSVIKEKSTDPEFFLNVSVYDGPVSVTNAIVEVLRVPPKVNIRYPDEMLDILPLIDQKKLELEILNKIVEYIMQTTDKKEIKYNTLYGKKREELL